jgi:hypothetical protein
MGSQDSQYCWSAATVMILLRSQDATGKRVDFQPIMLGAGPGPYSSSGVSGAVSLATHYGWGRKREPRRNCLSWSGSGTREFSDSVMTRFPVDSVQPCPCLDSILLLQVRIECISIGHGHACT